MAAGKLEAPKTDRTLLIVPELAAAPQLAERNAAELEAAELELLGQPLPQLRRQLRAQLAELAEPDSLAELCESGRRWASPWIVSGHQPTLFHPGVWLKNFVAAWLAGHCGGTPVHVIVDNDTVKSVTVRVPTGTRESPKAVHVPLDRWQGEMPFEEYQVADAGQFERFAATVTEAVRPLGLEPLVNRLWPTAVECSGRGNLGSCLSRARRAVEREWGCGAVEVPISRLASSEPFALFLLDMLHRLPEFQRLHNESLAAYRRRHKVRSSRHPVPELVRAGRFYEAPFWVWHAGRPRRQRLFAALNGRTVLLSDGADWQAELPADGPKAARRLVELAAAGVKIRPRALTCTLLLRLLLADLFVHGLGGARYDELTDELIRRFYQIDPPAFLTVTGTLYLPVQPLPASDSDRRQLIRRLRDLKYNPQKFIDISDPSNASYRQLVEKKWELIRQQPQTRRQRRERFIQIRALNAELAPAVAERLAEAEAELARVQAQLASNALLRNRDWAYCIHPADSLRDFYRPFLPCGC